VLEIDNYQVPAYIVDNQGNIQRQNIHALSLPNETHNKVEMFAKRKFEAPNDHPEAAILIQANQREFTAVVLPGDNAQHIVLLCEQLTAAQALTPQSELQENLLEMTERLAKIGHFQADIVNNTIEWSAETYRIYGEDPKLFTPTLSASFDYFTDGDHDKIKAYFTQADKHPDGFQFTSRIRLSDRSYRWIRCQAKTKISPNGQIISVFGVLQDLTSELASKEQMERLSLVASHTSNSVIICDRNGKVEWVNQGFERLTGFAANEAIGKEPTALLHGPLTDKTTQKEISESLNNYEPINCDIINYNKKGEHYWINVVISPIVQQDSLEGFIAIQTDISDRKKADSFIAQAQRMEAIGQLVGGVAHDFNNILGILRGNLELLELKLEQRDNKHLDKAFHACDRATGLTKKLLQFSRFKVTESKQIDPNQIIFNLADLLTKSLTQNVKLELNLATNIYSVWGSGGDIEDAILNLVINARDAMEGNGKVTISTENVQLDDQLAFNSHRMSVSPGEYVRLSIKDTGPGIPESIQNRIFEPFFTTKEQGSGLGLSMVYGFVQRSNGYILVDTGQDFGTEICIWLPRSDMEKPAVITPKEPTGAKLNRASKIYVVDDEPDILEIVSEYLSPLGCDVQTTTNSVEAQRTLLENKDIDLLITDEVMPGVVKGHTLVKTAIHANKKIRCIIMSGYNLDLGQIEGKADVLAKPFTRSELIDMINRNLKLTDDAL